MMDKKLIKKTVTVVLSLLIALFFFWSFSNKSLPILLFSINLLVTLLLVHLFFYLNKDQ